MIQDAHDDSATIAPEIKTRHIIRPQKWPKTFWYFFYLQAAFHRTILSRRRYFFQRNVCSFVFLGSVCLPRTRSEEPDVVLNLIQEPETFAGFPAYRQAGGSRPE